MPRDEFPDPDVAPSAPRFRRTQSNAAVAHDAAEWARIVPNGGELIHKAIVSARRPLVQSDRINYWLEAAKAAQLREIEFLAARVYGRIRKGCYDSPEQLESGIRLVARESNCADYPLSALFAVALLNDRDLPAPLVELYTQAARLVANRIKMQLRLAYGVDVQTITQAQLLALNEDRLADSHADLWPQIPQ
jgi:hypothetical protein